MTRDEKRGWTNAIRFVRREIKDWQLPARSKQRKEAYWEGWSDALDGIDRVLSYECYIARQIAKRKP